MPGLAWALLVPQPVEFWLALQQLERWPRKQQQRVLLWPERQRQVRHWQESQQRERPWPE
ncbi:MAG: hypothetical protein ABSG80_14600 [Verrucomicrobiota bacterium]